MQSSLPVVVIHTCDDVRRRLAEQILGVPGLALRAEGPDPAGLGALLDLEPTLVVMEAQSSGGPRFDELEGPGWNGEHALVLVHEDGGLAQLAFEHAVVDYLVAPYDDARIQLALHRAVERLEDNRRRSRLRARHAQRLPVRLDRRVEMVDVDGLLWVEAANQYVRLHLTGGQRLMRESMSGIEAALGRTRFTRVHRRAIVSMRHVRVLELLPRGRARLLLQNGEWIHVSRSRLQRVRESLRQITRAG